MRNTVSLTNRKRIISELGYGDTFPGLKYLRESLARLSVRQAYVKSKRQPMSAYRKECGIHANCPQKTRTPVNTRSGVQQSLVATRNCAWALDIVGGPGRIRDFNSPSHIHGKPYHLPKACRIYINPGKSHFARQMVFIMSTLTL